jgi:hypothetical protein
MKKNEYAELARLGVRSRLEQLQRHIADLFHEFPEEFAASTPPVFLKAEEKPGGNSWPAFTATVASSNGTEAVEEPSPQQRGASKRVWTAASRAKIAAATRARFANQKWGSTLWHEMHDYLLKQKNRQATVTAIAKALKVTKSSSITSAINRHRNRFRRVGPGLYRLVDVVSAAEKKNGLAVSSPSSHPSGKKRHTVPYAEKQPWGTYHWQKIHDLLAKQENRTMKVADMMTALDIKSAASVITSMMGHKDLFRRTGVGVYQLVNEDPRASA